MSRRNKNTAQSSKSKKQVEVPNSLAAVILIVVGVAIYFLFFHSSGHNTAHNRYAPTHSSTGPHVVTHKVPAPNAKNAPTLMIPDVKNLEIYRSDQIRGRAEIAEEKQHAELEAVRLKAATSKQKRERLNHPQIPEEYGMNSMPVQVIPQTVHVAPPVQVVSTPPVEVAPSVSLVSISRINNDLEAMLNFNGDLVSVNRKGVIYSANNMMPHVKVTRLTEQSVCLAMYHHTRCYKV